MEIPLAYKALQETRSLVTFTTSAFHTIFAIPRTAFSDQHIQEDKGLSLTFGGYISTSGVQ